MSAPVTDGTSDDATQAPGIRATVVYALPDRQWEVAVVLQCGDTVRRAIECSGLENSVPELQGREYAVGIFQRVCGFDTPVREGDRVEIYRPLLIDPKEARRLRVRKKRLPGGKREG
jgi:putative ubiquitin-RnfH superfamily antitoxin RatB of RatAB toxin-antitoxin module